MQSTIVPTTLPEVDVCTNTLSEGISGGSTKSSDITDDDAKCNGARIMKATAQNLTKKGKKSLSMLNNYR